MECTLDTRSQSLPIELVTICFCEEAVAKRRASSIQAYKVFANRIFMTMRLILVYTTPKTPKSCPIRT